MKMTEYEHHVGEVDYGSCLWSHNGFSADSSTEETCALLANLSLLLGTAEKK